MKFKDILSKDLISIDKKYLRTIKIKIKNFKSCDINK